MINVDVSCECLKCDKKMGEDDAYIYCGDCYEEKYTLKHLEEIIEGIAEIDYYWKDRDIYVGFGSEEEKDLFLNGVKHGYADCLFEICEQIGCMELFDKITQKMKFSKLEK